MFELVELLLACTFFLALPAVFLRDEHIVVDVIDAVAPRWVPSLRRIAGADRRPGARASWPGRAGRRRARRWCSTTSPPTSRCHRIWYWIPVLIGLIGAALAAAGDAAARGNGDA